jgi:hypothetical protein
LLDICLAVGIAWLLSILLHRWAKQSAT